MKKYLCLFALLAIASCGENADTNTGSSQSVASTEATVPQTPEERGRKLFNECAVCHSVRAGDSHRVGPNLHGIAGGEAGKAEGFAYSKAMADSDIVWDDASLEAFIENPQAFLKGNRMAYVGQRDEAKRADIIAYLKSLK
ncbi:c-type cytochrome [Hyphococcus lacteus]|uniref:C-type cytochrome n=1 Tax=Hyphococcus lacteus TaxID=3143536 RepID=A0ABV3Z781_9PROT